jgi:hypothetical protein
MKNIFSSLFRFSSFFLLLLFFAFVVSVSADKQHPSEELMYGGYTNWLESSLVETPADDTTAIGDNAVVKNANSLATVLGEQVLWIVEGKVGIGIETPEDVFEVYSPEDASVAVKSTDQKASLYLDDASFTLEPGGNLFLQLGEKKITLTDKGIEVNGEITVGGKNVIPAGQGCFNDDGTRKEGYGVIGTENDGTLICAPLTVEKPETPVCLFNNATFDAPITLMDECVFAAGENDSTPPVDQKPDNSTEQCNGFDDCKFDTTAFFVGEGGSVPVDQKPDNSTEQCNGFDDCKFDVPGVFR